MFVGSYTVGENIIDSNKMRNNYDAIIFTFLYDSTSKSISHFVCTKDIFTDCHFLYFLRWLNFRPLKYRALRKYALIVFYYIM